MRKARAGRMQGDAFLVSEAAERIGERIAAVNRTFEKMCLLDSMEEAARALDSLPSGSWRDVVVSRDERFPAIDEPFDVIASVFLLHAVNDLPGMLIQIRRALKPDGLFVAALFGGDTLTELRQSLAAAETEAFGGVSPRVMPFADVRDMGGLLQRAGFALPVADVERTVVRYRDLQQLFADLRAMGETNALVERSRKPIRRAILAATAQHYAENFSDPDGKLRATFDIVYLTGWAPHESQQRPLVPGSAKARLADALGTRELRSGDAPPKRQR